MNFSAQYSSLAKIFGESDLLMIEDALSEYMTNHASDKGHDWTSKLQKIYDVFFAARGWSHLCGKVGD